MIFTGAAHRAAERGEREVRAVHDSAPNNQETLDRAAVSFGNFASVSSVRREWRPRAIPYVAVIRAVPLITLLLVMLVLYLYAPHFYRLNNLINILVQTSALGLLATGMTFVMVSGGIDLSMPSAMAFGAVLGGIVMGGRSDMVLLGVLVMIVVPVAIGALNGFAVAYMRMLPFVVTLASMTIVGGVTVWITNSQTVEGFPGGFLDALTVRVVGIPVAVFVLLAFASIAGVLAGRSVYGRWVYAIGINAKAAQVTGIPERAVLFSTYVIAGLMAGVTGIVLVGRLGSASANMGADVVILDIVSSCVVGGISIYGGVGGPIGAVAGAIFITLISNTLNALGISFYITLIIKGAVIITFILLDNVARTARDMARKGS
jgi:ribose transport system permease protein